ncbi:hypothetical protein EG68_12305 [Paragonimus skrjabini miyazakii]|uniref:SOCS box domain-containing protein n=1 Tax=Paragonimus skrjabini miyazakii TaxID=59628 RepID=A0A8S9YNW8_9TREM|nr:hypothetical protein EG68_12305 [Paragonimus skrjabini miyazakii]
MCGATVALLLELFMATPRLFTFHIWSGQENLSVEQRNFWPVPPLIEKDLIEHVLQCQNYPHCLHIQLEESITEGRNFLNPLQRGVASSNDEEDAVFANDYRFVLYMCGATVALLLELLMATPHLFTFHIWSGQEDDSVEQYSFWPVPPLIEKDLIEHVLQCQNYPHCLHIQLEETISDEGDVECAWRKLSALWRVHRFSSLIRNKDSVVERVWGPPLLKDICRETIRRQLVQTTHPSFVDKDGQNLRENYIHLVFRLPIPQELKQFLIYEHLWPARDWHRNVQRLGRTECRPLKQECTAYRSVVYGPGLVYGHGFIPLNSHRQL